ncbi:hypothetical protein SARC_03458 [Sphaeroforma arctica JP610]|uniref:Uncharacterized protein n=1 Tax=Sphaeroforma arctica JP610 TaxID=667725 RepID=A0A0L0G5I1_9EUKA|nr:hypothetical protein SARC_03458 [Sphaeroforma arctica JP610]KNC84297.1 hypothetical protein SARC_03458 [Sphaeroforma arctica JP610]|eukprot:XP_014158199.1 hypothetical protein SARC_03458 [Sphaeroforma arctica JP610]
MSNLHLPTDRILDARHTVLCLVVDRSGSMASMMNQVHISINNYLDEQRRTNISDNLKTSVILITFDAMIETLWNGYNLDESRYVSAANVQPRDGTALYDAIAEGINRTVEFIQGLPKTPFKVVMFILTDGEENSSKQWSKNEIASQIKNLNRAPYNWEFYFAAANQDAIFSGLQLNIPYAQCITFAGQGGIQNAFGATGKAHTRMRRGQSKAYTNEEKTSAINSSEL